MNPRGSYLGFGAVRIGELVSPVLYRALKLARVMSRLERRKLDYFILDVSSLGDTELDSKGEIQ